jgi:hypothetical protein
MKKFGMYVIGRSEAPLHEFEGDYIVQDGDLVQVCRYGRDDPTRPTLVAAIKMEKKWVVKEGLHSGPW